MYLEVHFIRSVAHQKQRLILQVVGRHKFAQRAQRALQFGGGGARETEYD